MAATHWLATTPMIAARGCRRAKCGGVALVKALTKLTN